MLQDNGLVRRGMTYFIRAKNYRKGEKYLRAMALYNKAAESIVKAIFIAKTRKMPPKDVSISYLSMKSRIPQKIYAEFEESVKEEKTETALFEMEEFVRSLLIYAWNKNML